VDKKKIVVPEGMGKAAEQVATNASTLEILNILEAALQWLSENPIKPTDRQVDHLRRQFLDSRGNHVTFDQATLLIATEWQRRMFLLAEPEYPDIDELLKGFSEFGEAHKNIIEAYRRGRQSKG
jgi:hypothetical protein